MKNSIRKILIVVDIGLIFVLVCLLIFFYQLEIPLNKDAEEKEFIVKEGEGLKKIAENLKMERIIGNKWVFVLYVLLQGKTDNLQAGKYSLNPSMNIPQVSKKIINGEVFHDWVKITIPEGWTSKQIEEKLKENNIINQGEKLLDNLQGYLFPDTYYFYKNIGVDEVVQKMRDNFDKKVGKDVKYDVLKMASIIEREVKSDEDRAIVSGIFWKRIKNNYPLESCATIAYILDVEKAQYSYEDTRVKSPYNTYLNIGLPPTPINNPGLSAINAALNPQQTDYNFFLTDPKTGNTIFSKTFKEHNTNKEKYLVN